MFSANISTRRAARTAGLWYLGLALTGMCGFLMIRPALFAPGDPQLTLSQLLANASLARAGIALEMGVVITQAMAAVWFFRLFRSVDVVAAGTLAAFGLCNALAVLVSAALIATAFDVASVPARVGALDAAGAVQLMYLASGELWIVGAVFFGLWLVPMGRLVLASGWMPRALGWTLVVGGVGYVLSAFMSMLPELSIASSVATLPAAVGEFWMIGYLLWRGVRTNATGVS